MCAHSDCRWQVLFGVLIVADGFGEHGSDRVREALEAIYDRQHDILGAAVSELVHDAQLKLGTFILFDPEAEDFLAAIGADAERDVDRLAADHAFVADLYPYGVENTSG